MKEQDLEKMYRLGYFCSDGESMTEEQHALLKESIANLPDNFESLGLKSPIFIFLMSWFFGQWAVDRFLLGDTKMALIKLVTCGGCGIWTIYDWFTALKRAREYNFKKVTNQE